MTGVGRIEYLDSLPIAYREREGNLGAEARDDFRSR